MIHYFSKNKDEPGQPAWGFWRELAIFSSFNGLIFDVYDYRIGDTIFTHPTDEAKKAFEKELIWHKLQNKSNNLLIVVLNMDHLAHEIEHEKKNGQGLHFNLGVNNGNSI